MADKELAAKLARRLQAQNETDEEPKPVTSEPPPAPVIPQKIVSNPHVATDNTVNIDDLILNTLLKKESNNNTATTVSISPLVLPKSLDSNGNVTQSPMSPPPKTTIRNLLERDYQNNPASTQASPSRPLVGIVHHKKEERPATPTRQKTPEDGSELEKKLEAQRRKKIALDEGSSFIQKKEEVTSKEMPARAKTPTKDAVLEITGPVVSRTFPIATLPESVAEPSEHTPAMEVTPETPIAPEITPETIVASEVTPETIVASEVTPETIVASEVTPETPIAPEVTQETIVASEVTPETPIPRPRKSSFEELEEMFEREANEETELLKLLETKKPVDKQEAELNTAIQVSESTTAVQESKTATAVTQDSLDDTITKISEITSTVPQSQKNTPVAVKDPVIDPLIPKEELPVQLETPAEEKLPQVTEEKSENTETPPKAPEATTVTPENTVTDQKVAENNSDLEPVAEVTNDAIIHKNEQNTEHLVENNPEETTPKPETLPAEVNSPNQEPGLEKKPEEADGITDQDLDTVLQKALLAIEKPPVPAPVLASPALNKPSVPSPLLIEAIRIECGGLKSPPPLPPPKPQTPTHSRPQSPAIFKKAPVSPAMSSTSTEGHQSCTSTDKKLVDVDSCDELSELLERRQKIIEGDAVPERINRKLTLYAEFSEFSRKQIKFFTETFQKYDEDRDGFIDFNELKRMMEKLGEAQTHIALKQIIQKVDEDKDGKISIREFLLLFRLAAEGHFGCSEVFTQLAGSVDVSKEGVLGAASFFQAKIAEQTKLSKFEEEIKLEQDERKKEEEERKQRREKFLQNKSIFH